MNYYDAARVRKKGFANLMTDRLTSGQGIVSSIRGTLSDRSKARSMAMKEKFDPMNIAKFLTGGSNLAPAIIGRLMGRSKQDIGYFTGKKQYETRSRSNYFDKFNPSLAGGSKKATEVLEKIVSFMEKSREEDVKEQETLDSYNEMNEYQKADNHKEVMNVFRDAIKNQRKAMKEMAKEAKKRQTQEKAEASTAPASIKPTTKPPTSTAPASTKPPASTTAPVKDVAASAAKAAADKAAKEAANKAAKAAADKATKASADKAAKAAAEKATKDKVARDAADAKRIKDAANAKKAADTAKKQETVPAAQPSATSAPPVVAPKPAIVKPAITEAAKTAVKVGLGVGAGLVISSAAALSIERETGKPASQALKNVGQIVHNDPKAGVASYGIFGINSGGSVQSFVKDNPQFNLSAKPASKEFDEQWRKISTEQPQEMLAAQLMWYEKHITKPLKNGLTKLVPEQFLNDARVLIYMSDRRVQYGQTMEGKALKHASSAKSVEEFLRLISEYDLANLRTAFKTYLETHPNSIPGLEKRIREREKSALKVVPNDSGARLQSGDETGAELKSKFRKSEIQQQNSFIVNQNNTTNRQRNVEVNTSPSRELNPRIGN